MRRDLLVLLGALVLALNIMTADSLFWIPAAAEAGATAAGASGLFGMGILKLIKLKLAALAIVGLLKKFQGLQSNEVGGGYAGGGYGGGGYAGSAPMASYSVGPPSSYGSVPSYGAQSYSSSYAASAPSYSIAPPPTYNAPSYAAASSSYGVAAPSYPAPSNPTYGIAAPVYGSSMYTQQPTYTQAAPTYTIQDATPSYGGGASFSAPSYPQGSGGGGGSYGRRRRSAQEEKQEIEDGIATLYAGLALTDDSLCFPKVICELNSVPDKHALDKLDRQLLHLFRDFDPKTEKGSRQYQYRQMTKKGLTVSNPSSCSQLYPNCKVPSSDLLKIIARLAGIKA